MASMMELILPISKLSNYTAITQIMNLNEKSIEYGLILTHNDAVQLLETRSDALRTNERIEIGSGTIGKIIDTFYDSSYINQDDYANTLHELLEVFYYMKNETLDLISDDELIQLMKKYFENNCKGSLDLLKHRELEILARNIRYGIPDYSNLEDLDEDYYDEE